METDRLVVKISSTLSGRLDEVAAAAGLRRGELVRRFIDEGIGRLEATVRAGQGREPSLQGATAQAVAEQAALDLVRPVEKSDFFSSRARELVRSTALILADVMPSLPGDALLRQVETVLARWDMASRGLGVGGSEGEWPSAAVQIGELLERARVRYEGTDARAGELAVLYGVVAMADKERRGVLGMLQIGRPAAWRAVRM